ncbi:MAG: hypothetical protein A2017_00110 [Lentisphaerae bacterium GWF2_44_16]|nr:MAG: hypothetical protein A2017_00110 [Lentisphaerae bacterium GWF2_44_16]
MILHDEFFMEWWEKNSQKFKAVFFDIDGTLISGRRLLPGADKMLDWLKSRNFPFYLLTNDGNHSQEEKSAHIRKTGLDTAPEEIISCGDALKSYVKNENISGRTFYVMGDLGVPCYAEKADLKVSRDLKRIDKCDGVIVGEGTYDWQANIQGVMNFFKKHPERLMLVPNPDSYWPNGPSGEIGIGAGGKARFIVSILSEMGVEIEPVYLGKPYQAIYDYALSLLCERFNIKKNFKRSEIIMLGDFLKSDIMGANKAGFTSVLMLTGVTGLEQAKKAEGDYSPDHVFESFI